MGWVSRGFVLALTVFAFAASAKGPLKKDYVEGFFHTSSDRDIYYKYYPGNRDEALTAVNGLTQDTEHWQTDVAEMRATGGAVLLYDAFNQGRSLEKYIDDENVWGQIGIRPVVQPLLGERMLYGGREPLIQPTPIESQAQDLAELHDFLKIKKSTIAGLSYGGALALQYAAMYPERTNALILEDPYIEPMAAQDKLVRFFMDVYARAFPLMNFDEDELYDWILRGLVLTTYHLSEPTALKWGLLQPFAVSQLASGVRHLDAVKLVAKMKVPIHLVIAGNSQYVQRGSLLKFWEKIPEQSQASLIVVEGVEHKMNEAVGPYLGALMRLLSEGRRKLLSGKSWVGIPEKGLLKSKDGKEEFVLAKSSICENFLRPTHPTAPNLPVDRIPRNPAELFIHSWRAQLPPEYRKQWDLLAKFWFGK